MAYALAIAIFCRSPPEKSPALLGLFVSSVEAPSPQETTVKQGRTIVFTTHKLYYASSADRILYMEDGAVKESGSHKK